MSALEIQGLSAWYAPEHPVLKDCSFSFGEHEVVGLIGLNGAGKTTTLRMLATLIRPDSGDAVLSGSSVVTQPEEVRRKIGFLTSELKLEDFFT
ncbi:MAG: ATP-binding cassette domain-containing protein, partial [Peptococcaceae bacterium]|nr:ATP-binding cassette domain-containing protein [Peptococcaceae bacterium]